MSSQILLSVRNYSQHFVVNRALTVRAVNGISFDLRKGEVFGLVGESGCGKSTVARGIMGIYTPTGGEILFRDYPITEKRSYRLHRRDVQRNIQVIFQDSAAALNPRMTVAEIIAEPLVINRVHADKARLRAEVGRLLGLVGLDAGYGNKLPGELYPELIVADEPVASLDVSIQAQIISLFQHLQRQHGFTFLFIAHDLSMVRYLCDRVGVMYAGKLVETAPAKELFENPLHPYTRALLSAVPVPDPVYERSKRILPYTRAEADLNGEWREVSPDHHLLVPTRE